MLHHPAQVREISVEGKRKVTEVRQEIHDGKIDEFIFCFGDRFRVGSINDPKKNPVNAIIRHHTAFQRFAATRTVLCL